MSYNITLELHFIYESFDELIKDWEKKSSS